MTDKNVVELVSYLKRIVRNDGPQTHVAGFHFPANITRQYHEAELADLLYDRTLFSYVALTEIGATLLFFSVGPNKRIASEEYQQAINLLLPAMIGPQHALETDFIEINNRMFEGDFTYQPRILHDEADCQWLNRVFEGFQTFSPRESYTDYDVSDKPN